MKLKTKKILLGVLITVGVIIVAFLIWILANYKYLTNLTLSYDRIGLNEVEYEDDISSMGFPLTENAKEAVFYLKGQVIKGEITVSVYKTSDDPEDSSAFYLEEGSFADEDAVLLYTGTFKEGDTIDVEESLGSLTRGYYMYDVEESEDLEIQIWRNLDTYNYGWVHEKYKFMNKLRRWGLLNDRKEI